MQVLAILSTNAWDVQFQSSRISVSIAQIKVEFKIYLEIKAMDLTLTIKKYIWC